MMRGLFHLTWLEIKIFLREPLGAIGTLVIPVLLFVGVGGGMNRGGLRSPGGLDFLQSGLPVLVSVFMAIGAVTSLVAIISIYREGGILKRLRATPLRPQTILSAHVLAKLLFTAITLALMMMAGRRFYPPGLKAPVISFAIAVLFSTLSILSMGFVIASVVRTARFAQPVGALVFYPMIALSGLFVPIEVFPRGVQMAARFLPLTYIVSLLRGIWNGESWFAHLGDVAALAVGAAIFVAISSRMFRWE
ncbi:MAG TPA: ABC transporter permease [Vicinamibacterales bacterium]|nr:ABC transporter permease [Vicinamibacterales bacterium]